MGAEAGQTASAVSRGHQIVVSQSGVISIAGGKRTTYRKMSREVVDMALDLLKLAGTPVEAKGCTTDKRLLVGGRGWPDSDDHDEVAAERGAAMPRLVRAPAEAIFSSLGSDLNSRVKLAVHWPDTALFDRVSGTCCFVDPERGDAVPADSLWLLVLDQ